MKINTILPKVILKNKILILVFILFSVITFWGLINHAPWRDEAQAWLLVRDLSLPEIITQMPYEGTPPLWHLLILPLVKLGAPYETMLFLHYLLSLALIFILLFYSPLPKLIKIFLPFNYYFIFEYSLIARNYNLTALLLFIIAMLYQKRFEKPLLYALFVFLLSWTNVHSLAFAGLLLLLFIYDYINKKLKEKKIIIATLIMLTGLSSAIIIMLPQADQAPKIIYNQLAGANKAFATALVPWLGNDEIIASNEFYSLINLAWLPIILFLLQSWKTKTFFALTSFWLLYIFLFKHAGDFRHYGLILILFIFLWWLDIIENKEKTSIATNLGPLTGFIVLLAVIFNGLFYAGTVYAYTPKTMFSGAKEMAEYLQNNNLINEEIAAYPSYSGSALLPYLPGKEFYQMECLKKGTFLTWNNIFMIGQSSSYQLLKNELKIFYKKIENRPKNNSILLLTVLPPGFDSELEYITKTSKKTIKKDEFFYLYRLNINK